MNKYLFEYLYSNNVDGEGQDLMIVRANDIDTAIYYFETWTKDIGVIKKVRSSVFYHCFLSLQIVYSVWQ